MSDLPIVEVLLATYNGARFLRQQVDSILQQDYPEIRILARDDGSSDGTAQVLLDYARRLPERFRVMPASPASGSPQGNFLRLMRAATGQYVCFADQDDVWLPDKVSKSKIEMDKLEQRWGESMPLLVFTDLRVVDGQLDMLHASFWSRMRIDPECVDELPKLLVQGIVTGCTSMLNRALLRLSLSMPEEAAMHDRWVSLLASSMGKYTAVNAQTVLYRQHGSNVLGIGPTKSYWQRLRRGSLGKEHVFQWQVSQRQAAALLRLHGPEMAVDKRISAEAFLRCEEDKNPFVRSFTWLRHGFFHVGLLANALTIFHLLTRKPKGKVCGAH